METAQRATLGKRLLAIIYDALIIFFIIFVLTILIQIIVIQSGLIMLEQVPINADGDMVDVIPLESPVNLLIKSLWTIVSFFYLAYYWIKRGQTPGMKVWKIKLIANDGQLISWKQALYRYVFSLFGLGLLWILFDKSRLALQDRLSGSQLINVSVPQTHVTG